ncbi:hypothetical protein TI39_contig71g00020 [Zymoseptoria brevis]|uniref:Uncharacterized protein n=1 Tax=Zymoseptoria brevis TaxID=1047168 RepID=A0A0F4GYX8_9PEZI|nr:hypothetical protein TI39_contig71g00020 [Zymoseptoria brevis]
MERVAEGNHPHGLPPSPDSEAFSPSSALPQHYEQIRDMGFQNIASDVNQLMKERAALDHKTVWLFGHAQQLCENRGKDIFQLVAEKQELSRSLEQAALEKQQLSRFLEEAAPRHQQLVDELAGSQQQEAGFRQANAELRLRNEQQQDNLDRQEERLISLQEEKDKLKADLTLEKTQSKAADEQLALVSERCDRLDEDAADLKQTITSQKGNISDLSDQCRTLQEQNDALNNANVDLRNEETIGSRALKESYDTNDSLTQDIAAQTARQKEDTLRIAKLQREIDTHKPIKEVEEANRQLQEEIDGLRQHGETQAAKFLQEEVAREREMKSLLAQMKDLKAQCADAEQKREAEQKQVTHLTAKAKEQQVQADLSTAAKDKDITILCGKLKRERAENERIRGLATAIHTPGIGVHRGMVTAPTEGTVQDHDEASPPAKRQRANPVPQCGSYRGGRGGIPRGPNRGRGWNRGFRR